MAGRLSKLEMTNHNQRQEIHEKVLFINEYNELIYVKTLLIERLQKDLSLLRSQLQGSDSIIKSKVLT